MQVTGGQEPASAPGDDEWLSALSNWQVDQPASDAPVVENQPAPADGWAEGTPDWMGAWNSETNAITPDRSEILCSHPGCRGR